MKELKKIRLKDVSDKETLDVDQLAKLTGGFELYDGCGSRVCNNGRSAGTVFCEGGAVCTSGVGECNQKT